ncbi:MAG: DUF1501 domain-containing protein [Planctomycetes bacterium]|nr:DUF1501 domain-containing protein [Planctomycetota bacterium]
MLRILGSPRTACDGMTRRDLLHLGGLGLFGVGVADLFRLQDAQAAGGRDSHFGRARSCILIHLFGAHAQHETFDPKPDAPAEIQGELKAIATSVPGVSIGEGLPRIARVMDRLTVVRSLTHPWPFHGVHYALSGIPTISQTVEADPTDRSLWPFIGSVVDYVEAGRANSAPAMPQNIALPFRLYSRANFRLLGGPYAGFLGSRFDPIWTEFAGRGTRAVPNPTAKPDVFDPYGGIRAEDGIDLTGPIPTDLSPQRVGLRRSLLQQLDQSRSWLDGQDRVQAFGRHQELAYALLTSPRLARALDIHQESEAVRTRYGMTLFGQSLLAARRLVEGGGRFVTVFWDAYGDATGGWDTHYYHYPRLKELLLPGLDEAFSALILDLEARGLLDETLVLVLSEHGRTPRLTNRPGGGREHWSSAYCGVLAGGGAARGGIVGRSDGSGGQVADTPVSPKDILATALHLLGVDPHMMVPDRLNRPVPVAGDGLVRPEILG